MSWEVVVNGGVVRGTLHSPEKLAEFIAITYQNFPDCTVTITPL